MQRRLKSHVFRDRNILPCENTDSIRSGARWYVRTQHSATGLWYAEEHSPQFCTLADAREHILDEEAMEGGLS